jgi:methionyl-tRNA synthetase
LSEVAKEVVAACRDSWQRFAAHEALEATWRLVRAANSELETQEPWKLAPGPALDASLGDALEALRIVSVLVSPVMPDAAAEIWARIGLQGRPDEPGMAGDQGGLSWGGYPGNLTVIKGAPLFPRRSVDD